MKVFISWSGSTSHRVALVLRDWLPSVIQVVSPYVSSEDIDKGTRWSTDIAGELHASSYGIICLTKDNLNAPWINFEAGALGKSVDKSRVSPFLLNLKRSEVSGPILQFQSTIVDKADIFKLLTSINSACGDDGLELSRLETTFDVWWPRLETALTEISSEDLAVAGEKPESSKISVPDVLEELLELTRNNHKLLRDPSALLPPGYLEKMVSPRSSFSPLALMDLMRSRDDAWLHLKRLETELVDPPEAFLHLIDAFEAMEKPLQHIARMNPETHRFVRKRMSDWGKDSEARP